MIKGLGGGRAKHPPPPETESTPMMVLVGATRYVFDLRAVMISVG